MARTQANIDRALDRKMAKVQAHSFSGAGPSLLDWLEAQLFDACWTYNDLRHIQGFGPNDVNVRYVRGVVRGLATSIMRFRRMYKQARKCTTRAEQIEYVRRTEMRWIGRVRRVQAVCDTLPESRSNDNGIQAKW